MDIARAFAAHPDVASAAELVAGIERVFVEGAAAHSVLIDGARAAIAELHGRGFCLGHRHQRLRSRHRGVARPARHHGMLRLRRRLRFGLRRQARPAHGVRLLQGGGSGAAGGCRVGDAVHDLAMGRAASVGLNVGVLSGTSGREDLAGLADVIVASIAELPARPELGRRIPLSPACGERVLRSRVAPSSRRWSRTAALTPAPSRRRRSAGRGRVCAGRGTLRTSPRAPGRAGCGRRGRS